MTVCDSCKKLCDGLGPLCWDCKEEADEYLDLPDTDENFEPIPSNDEWDEP